MTNNPATTDPLPPFPSAATHFFTDVFLPALPEVNPKKLEELSQLATANDRAKSYRGLRDALQRIQWTKMAAEQAIMFDAVTTEQQTKDVLVQEPFAQIQHGKAVFDGLAHGKAALDHMAVFLNRFYEIGQEGGNRDLRKPRFREALSRKEPSLGRHIASIAEWLDPKRATTDGIVAARDAWIHKGGIVMPHVYPPAEVGSFPIPRRIAREHEHHEAGEFWSTREFFSHHLQQLFSLFNLIVERTIDAERQLKPNFEVHHDEGPAILFLPLLVTEKIQVTQRLGRLSGGSS